MRPVLIVEDHPLVAEATGRRLAHYGEDLSIVVCSSAAQTLAALDLEHTDWFRIFLDLDVPGAYGLSLAREIRDRRLAAKCCVVSAFDRRDYIEELQAWGFLGYIVKAVSVSEFTFSINSVVEGRSQFPQPSRTERAALSPLRLTRRQTEILELVRAGLSSKQIAGALNVTGGTVRGAAMTDKATQDEREAFENWGNTDASDEDVAERALLNDSPTQFHAWLAWQARATLQSTEPALPEPFGRTGTGTKATVCRAMRH